MNYRHFVIALAAGMCLMACNPPRERTIDRPLAGVRNTRTFEIDKIVLTDTATIVYIDAFFRPHNWVRMDTTAYLYGGGKKYMITGAEGMELCTEHYMPASGEDSFVFYYKPIDPKLKTIDFIEGDPDDYFKIWDIQLRDGKPDDRYLSAVPRSVRNADHSGAVIPKSGLLSAETVVKVHLLGEPAGNPMTPELYISSILDDSREEPKPVSSENGTYTYNLPLYGPTQVAIVAAGHGSTVMLDPGVENNVWIDLVAASREASRYNREKAGSARKVYTDGRYAAVNAVLADKGVDPRWKLDMLWGSDVPSKLKDNTSAEIADYVRKAYDDKLAELSGTDFSVLEKDVITRRLNGEYLFTLSQLPFMIDNERRRALGLNHNDPLPAGYVPPTFSADDYAAAFEGLNVAGMPSIYADYPDFVYSFVARQLSEQFGLAGTLADHVSLTQTVMHFVERSEEAPENIRDKFDSIPDPAFKEAVALKERVVQEKLDAALAKGGYVIRDIPEVADDKLFDAIAARYAGKVVVVDFWATWCGPCRASMAKHEPHKDDYAGKDAVFVYLTGPSSPETTWRIMIGDVKGEHYRLSESQWRAVCDKFDVTGIPSWVVVTKKGEYLKENMWDASAWASVIDRELAK